MANYREDIVNIEMESGSVFRSFMSNTIGSGDELANRFGVRAFRNGSPEALSGTCTGYFIRADGSMVVINEGVIDSNVAYVDLPESCYAVEGQFKLTIKVTTSGSTTSMRIIDGVVSRTTTSTIVDPGTLVTDIDDLIEAIEEAAENIPQDYSALSAGAARVAINSRDEIPANGNLNDYTTPGQYRVTTNAIAETISNIPEQITGLLTVQGTVNDNWVRQIYYPAGGTGVYTRAYNNSTSSWGRWQASAYENYGTNGYSLQSKGNADNLTRNAIYFVSYSNGEHSITNIPADSESFGWLRVTRINSESLAVVQEYIDSANGNIYVRRSDASGVWGTWKVGASDRVMQRVTNGTYTSLFDLPDNCWWAPAYNSTVITALENDNFPYTLRDTRYFVEKRRQSTDYHSYEVYSHDGKDHWIGTTGATHPSTITWNRIPDGNWMDSVNARMDEENDDIAVQVYTDFEQTAGWWWTDGSLINTSGDLKHSQNLPVVPGRTYYVGSYWDHTCWGYFFDREGNKLSPLLQTDISEHTYNTPDADPDTKGTSTFTYVKLYKFTVPQGAYYFSYNIYTTDSTHNYRQYIASIPVFRKSNTGNLILRKSDPAYQFFGKRKLCIIGPSFVMIDRLQRTGNFLNNGSNQTQFVVGFQEYLMPYWQSVNSFGFSGASYGKLDSGTGVLHTSIYTRICTEHVADLSGYDDYILTGNQNLMVTTGAGSVSTWNDLGDEETYIGAVRHIMEYIYTVNPDAKIYNCNMQNLAADFTSAARRTVLEQVNDELHKISRFTGSPVIDLAAGSGMNNYSVQRWTYDGTHANQLGSQYIGEYLRKAIVGV